MDHLTVAVCDNNSRIAADVVVGSINDAADAVASLAKAGLTTAVRFTNSEKYFNIMIGQTN